ncbi:hypothetical protein ACTNEO_08575 [Gracilibacillus sp. HCP3S3_G5_1]|uniref:hypothetical protein n=1 Tax=unclassified Gracilibacillus TaxID=2625209 RepID=UPI003F8CBD28
MRITFNPDIKWKKYMINWSLYVLGIVIVGMIMSFNLSNTRLIIAIILYGLLILFAISRMFFYFKLPSKVYLRVEKDYISLYRPNLISHKKIEYRDVNRIVERKDQILLIMDNGKEEQIQKEWLTEGDLKKLIAELQAIFGEKAFLS